ERTPTTIAATTPRAAHRSWNWPDRIAFDDLAVLERVDLHDVEAAGRLIEHEARVDRSGHPAKARIDDLAVGQLHRDVVDERPIGDDADARVVVARHQRPRLQAGAAALLGDPTACTDLVRPLEAERAARDRRCEQSHRLARECLDAEPPQLCELQA